ncbi:hypothetical protein HMPREF9946_03125 [Acetobacteraceae bacterium AT-5844]|nr:hypothetical protein HMPREF9946_03125 [Acetobacteraceae bacterium AT-5844]
MTVEERLAALERRMADIERRMGPEMPTQLPAIPYIDHYRRPAAACGCPPGTICANAACPMLPKFTSGFLNERENP